MTTTEKAIVGDGEPPPTEGRIIQTTLEWVLRTHGSSPEALDLWEDLATAAIKRYRGKILAQL